MTEKAIPKYMQLKRELLSWIESGQLKPDEKAPSEHEIAGRFGMSRQTVRQALGELEKEGLLYRVQGKGTFIARQPARQLQQRGCLIGMMTTHISDYIFPHIVRGAEARLRAGGYSLMLSSTDNDKKKERENLEQLIGQPISGLIIEPTKSAEGNPNLPLFLSLDVHNIPYIMINERYPELHCPCLKVDDEAGGFMAAEHLIELGHTRIAGFFKTDDLQGANRLKGFIRAMHKHRLPFGDGTVTHYTSEEKQTVPYEAALGLLQGGERPTAFVCYNDELAVLLLEAARQRGLSVPGDLSIIGFDDSSLATATEVKLTTLSHPKTQMGIEAAEMLIGIIEGRNSEAPLDIIYKPELILRGSTKAIGKGAAD
ncbi:GntR family transcriptional regulator [Paenibacillus sp. URB8-2]|uniref:GntR family transcriptional regulator n=1 Tax=Paenibacillus sp. URB8-2 TaxID=2741301 RepID=UPI0015BBA6B3|nr:GntR family transcriptional regulator [Paenibacillus sp. URB8-2]BCG58074.1 arabinose metabolism transcriptional repressor [Paenibacillus sp. URB8-2]